MATEVGHGPPGSKARISQLQRSYYDIPRLIRILLIATAVLLVGGEAATWIQADFDARLKTLPTDFDSLAQRSSGTLRTPQQPVRHANGTGIGDRYIFVQHLGTGAASLYVDVPTGETVVVKAWSGASKTIRNYVPEDLAVDFEDYADKWSCEIEASLLLEGWYDSKDTAYVPVRDYFVLDHGGGQWDWAMVTPFFEGGTLRTLAEATKIHERTPQKLDQLFRPAFNALLQKLGELHEAGYCHDSIEPDGILIANTTHWLFGDLDDVRHIGHPWHATDRWKQENQKPGCKANDVHRLLKTYMTFLREAAASRAIFDDSFYEEDQAWSRLYGDYVDWPVSARDLLTMSEDLRSGVSVETGVLLGREDGEMECLSRSIDRELTLGPVETHWAYWLPFRGC